MKGWKLWALRAVAALAWVGFALGGIYLLSAAIWAVQSIAERVESSKEDCRSQVMVMAVTEHSKSAWTGCGADKTLTVETLPDGSSVLVQCLCPTEGTP